MSRDFETHPYSKDEARVAEFIVELSAGIMGGGDDPIAYVLALAKSDVALVKENDDLRAALADSLQPCIYCGLAATEIAKCKHGFPGCGRMDDLMAKSEKDGERRAAFVARQEALEEAALCVEARVRHAVVMSDALAFEIRALKEVKNVENLR